MGDPMNRYEAVEAAILIVALVLIVAGFSYLFYLSYSIMH
jgi:hypothetical protein